MSANFYQCWHKRHINALVGINGAAILARLTDLYHQEKTVLLLHNGDRKEYSVAQI